MTELIEQMLPEQMQGFAITWGIPHNDIYNDDDPNDRILFFYLRREFTDIFVYNDEVAIYERLENNKASREVHLYNLADPGFDVEKFIKTVCASIRNKLPNAVDD